MRISELARRAGVTTKAVRYYESLGLITPGRLANGYRDYDENDVRLAREIRALRRLGIPAERTRPFLDCLQSGRRHADDCPASLAGYREAVDELTERIGELTARRAALISQLQEAAHRNSSVSPAHEGEDFMNDYLSLPADLPAPEDDGAAGHLPGMKAPSLELSGTAGGTIRLDALAAGRTVIYVYPLTGRPGTDLPEGWDSIPGARGCTPESCGFRDHYQDLLAAGAADVFGLSGQDTGYQREVVERLRLPFQMLSDPALDLVGMLGLPTFEAGGLTLYKRLTLIILDGVIEHVFYPVFPPSEHADQVLTWLRDNPL
ncbi:MerR family transcriptional regulator [Streptomyces hiroshimensis]|uniref:Thiol-specific antioxidant related protein/Peroxidoxin BcpB n=1 Tax=Streptomyces hiroshimensis TaxID=66424 RepID=A0ABQ2Z0W4_9ACTN|nr:MerR family transcriptional regulator [Streptomyces hiroshimensis]GGY01400.1 putative thiol-specific antioxidant related protein/Peroxidoxin BcpB [Streptomyces hiroshimensis]